MIHINLDQLIKDITKGLAPVTDKQLRIAVSRSINRSLETGRTQLKREISNIYNIKINDARSELPLINSKSSVLIGKIMARTSMIPLEKFSPIIKTGEATTTVKRKKGYSAVYSRKRKNRQQGVYVTILKSEGRQRMRSAFMLYTGKWAGKISARGRYNNRFNFNFREKRVVSGMDFPIGSLKGMSILSGATNKKVLQRTRPIIEDNFKIRLVQELQKGIAYGGIKP